MKLKCIDCGKEYSWRDVRYSCDCRGSLEVIHNFNNNLTRNLFDDRLSKEPFSSGVWRYKELIFPQDEEIITKNEGNTRLYESAKINKFTSCDNVLLKHEGENPTGSFKDRGMTVGITVAKILGFNRVASASTGNTSASMAAYASAACIRSLVFIPDGEIAYGKLAQALAYGAKTLKIKGNFDKAMEIVQRVSSEFGFYLLNSINPFRLEGQKSIYFETLQQLKWKTPDWFVLPGGNLGNNSALSKALREFYELKIINRIPRIAVIQAKGANPLVRMWKKNSSYQAVRNPKTLATAIKIGNPVNWKKSLLGIRYCDGVVEEVSEQEIIDAKAHVDGAGIGAEPASCATVAGIKKLTQSGTIKKNDLVVGILTGNILKDPDIIVNYHLGKLKQFNVQFINRPITVGSGIYEIKKTLKKIW